LLSPAEFTVGALTGAPHMSLVIPHDEHSGCFFPLRLEGRGTFAVFLTGEDRFRFFHYGRPDDEEDAHFLKGIVISQIAIELDETSAYDPDSGNRALGSLIRTQERLEIIVRSARERVGQTMSLPIITELPGCEAGARAAFTRWRIVLGEGQEKRELVLVDCMEVQA
jgi:hypothetical protein